MKSIANILFIFISLTLFKLIVSESIIIAGTNNNNNCSSHLTCTQCVSSTSNSCDWCLGGNRCTDNNSTLSCREDFIVTGINVKFTQRSAIARKTNILQRKQLQRSSEWYRSGPSFCPSINANDNGNEITATLGATKKIIVNINISNEALLTAMRFVCQLNIEGKLITVNGQLFGDKIYCDSMQLTYKSNTPNVTTTFNILRNGLIPLDNPDNIHVVIYRCGEPNDGCDKCLALPENLNCGWCRSKSQCNVHEQCDKFNERINDWLSRTTKCPKQ